MCVVEKCDTSYSVYEMDAYLAQDSTLSAYFIRSEVEGENLEEIDCLSADAKVACERALGQIFVQTVGEG